jgi:hypothetical protein
LLIFSSLFAKLNGSVMKTVKKIIKTVRGMAIVWQRDLEKDYRH